MTDEIEAKDHFGQDINVDDRVLLTTGVNRFAWGKVLKVTPQKVQVDYEKVRGKSFYHTLYKFHKDVVVIGEDMMHTIAIHKLTK